MPQPQLNTAIPVLLSLDIPTTVRFYTEKLGFTCRWEQAGGAILERDGITLNFTKCPEQHLVDWSCCRVSVTGIDALYEEFAGRGVTHPSPHSRPHDTDYRTREFGVVDPHGVLITFFENTA